MRKRKGRARREDVEKGSARKSWYHFGKDVLDAVEDELDGPDSEEDAGSLEDEMPSSDSAAWG
jgi:hypothetical protein